MSKRTPWACAALFVSLIALQAAGQSGSGLPMTLRQATEAYQKGDHAAFLAAMKKAQEIAPDQPNVLYNLACAEALTGRGPEACKLLDRLATLGLGWSAAQDGDFDSIRATPCFKSFLGKLEKSRVPVHRSEAAFTLPQKDFLPEGIAYDPATEAFYFTSPYCRKIVVRSKDGSFRDFIGEAQDGFLGGLGAKVDAQRRHLWVCTSALPGMKGFEPVMGGLAGVFQYDLGTGKLLKKYVLDGKPFPHTLNDLVISSAGDVYATDSSTGAVYAISGPKEELVQIVPFWQYPGANGIALSAHDSLLYVAFDRGIGLINLKTKDRLEVSHPEKVYCGGIDGLYLCRNGLLGIQASARRVVRFPFGKTPDRIEKGEVLEAFNPLFEHAPTTGVVAGSLFYYIANSQLDALAGGKLARPEALVETTVLKTRLEP